MYIIHTSTYLFIIRSSMTYIIMIFFIIIICIVVLRNIVTYLLFFIISRPSRPALLASNCDNEHRLFIRQDHPGNTQSHQTPLLSLGRYAALDGWQEVNGRCRCPYADNKCRSRSGSFRDRALFRSAAV